MIQGVAEVVSFLCCVVLGPAHVGSLFEYCQSTEGDSGGFHEPFMVESLTRFVEAMARVGMGLIAVAVFAAVLQWVAGEARVRLSFRVSQPTFSLFAGLRRLFGAHQYDRPMTSGIVRSGLRMLYYNSLALIVLFTLVVDVLVEGDASLPRLLGIVVVAAVVSELIGFGLRYRDWMVSIRMDDTELRREQRENEGDPWMRSLQRELGASEVVAAPFDPNRSSGT